MAMNRPVILDHIQVLYLSIALSELSIEANQLLASYDVVIQIVDLSTQGIQRANHAPLTVVTSALDLERYLIRCRDLPISSSGGPSVVAHLVEEHQSQSLRLLAHCAQTLQQPRFLTGVVGIWAEVTHQRRSQTALATLQHTPDTT